MLRRKVCIADFPPPLSSHLFALFLSTIHLSTQYNVLPISSLSFRIPGKHKDRQSYTDLDRPHGQHLTERERTQLNTLQSIAHWGKRAITRELHLPYTTILRCVASGCVTPPSKPIGRRPLLTTRKRKRLVDRATLDVFHRLSYEEIAQIEGIQACSRSLKVAFENEQFHRRIASPVQAPLL